jgi:hypothetical protein
LVYWESIDYAVRQEPHPPKDSNYAGYGRGDEFVQMPGWAFLIGLFSE